MKRKQVSKADSAKTIGALVGWRDAAPATSREQIAACCGRSMSTVDRWFNGMSEPTVSDIRHLEAYKQGLVHRLFEGKRAAPRPNGKHMRAVP